MMKKKFPVLCLFYLVVIPFCFGSKKQSENYTTVQIKTGYFEIQEADSQLHLNIWKKDRSKLRVVLLTKNAEYQNSNQDQLIKVLLNCEIQTTCISVANDNYIKIKASVHSEVIEVKYSVNQQNGQIKNCFMFEKDTEWFGGPETNHQVWPIQHDRYEKQAYIPSHSRNMGITERYWLSSKGMYILVSRKDPLFVDQNNLEEMHLCLISESNSPYHVRNIVTLRYEIGVFSDPREAHEHVIRYHFGVPTGYPDEKMVTHPIWSTWARYKIHVNDTIVRKFADEIKMYGFENSQIEIDDNWEDCYGSAKFDSRKFPNVEKLVSDLKKKGFRVTLWIHPFINRFCGNGAAFFFARKNNFFVKNIRGSDHTTWWQGRLSAGVIDFTNEKAVEWWIRRLKNLEKLGFDGFKFDAGEASWLPKIARLFGPNDLQPGIFTFNYTSNLAKYFKNKNIEVRTGWGTQNLPIFVRMLDKDTSWSWNNGLPTLITTLLQMNINGYVFVLPDMIGGNGYTGNSFNSSKLPSKELFIRWLQASVFMPSLQFSFVPWDYDNETIAISKTFTKLHANFSPLIIELMEKVVKTGDPINPPIWWVDPLNRDLYKINDEFLLGEKVLVAPILINNITSRDVYLPRGKWKDGNNHTMYDGPTILRNYPAPLHTLPYFLKMYS